MRLTLINSAILVLSLALSSITYAGTRACLLAGDRSSSSLRIAEALNTVPELRQVILELLNHPKISVSLRRLLENSLIRKETQVEYLTAEIRKTLNIPDNFTAAYISINRPVNLAGIFKKKENEPQARGKKTLNEAAVAKLNDQNLEKVMTGNHIALIPKGTLSKKHNSVAMLVHELSHARFELHFSENAEKLLGKLPKWIIRKTWNGEIKVHRQFYDLLNERYAFEKQFEVTRVMDGVYYTGRDQIFQHVESSYYKWYLAEIVPLLYNIRDKRLEPLQDYLIHDILLGKPFQQKESSSWSQWLNGF